MSDNTILNPGVNGDVARSIDRAGVKTQVVAIDLGGQAGPENLLGEGRMPITAETLPLPTGAATQATLAALSVIAQAISDAVAALNGKATTINTGAIGGTVALDAPTLAALESITASTGGLTNAELRAAAVPISADALPLPTGAATEATLSSLATLVSAHDDIAVDGHPGIPLLVRRRDSDAEPMVDDGDFTFLALRISAQRISVWNLTHDR